jgi:hypothetical protein
MPPRTPRGRRWRPRILGSPCGPGGALAGRPRIGGKGRPAAPPPRPGGGLPVAVDRPGGVLPPTASAVHVPCRHARGVPQPGPAAASGAVRWESAGRRSGVRGRNGRAGRVGGRVPPLPALRAGRAGAPIGLRPPGRGGALQGLGLYEPRLRLRPAEPPGGGRPAPRRAAAPAALTTPLAHQDAPGRAPPVRAAGLSRGPRGPHGPPGRSWRRSRGAAPSGPEAAAVTAAAVVTPSGAGAPPPGPHTTALRRAASRNHSALSLGVRARVWKST